MNQFNQIEIIDTQSVRYIGSLHGIEAKSQTVSLKNITVFGTEDRECETAIPASSEVIALKEFTDKTIKALKVLTGTESHFSSGKKEDKKENKAADRKPLRGSLA